MKEQHYAISFAATSPSGGYGLHL